MGLLFRSTEAGSLGPLIVNRLFMLRVHLVQGNRGNELLLLNQGILLVMPRSEIYNKKHFIKQHIMPSVWPGALQAGRAPPLRHLARARLLLRELLPS